MSERDEPGLCEVNQLSLDAAEELHWEQLLAEDEGKQLEG